MLPVDTYMKLMEMAGYLRYNQRLADRLEEETIFQDYEEEEEET